MQQSIPRRPGEAAAVGSLGQEVGGLCRSKLPREKEDGEGAKGTFLMQAIWGPELHGMRKVSLQGQPPRVGARDG